MRRARLQPSAQDRVRFLGPGTKISQVASTMMACPDGMDTEAAFTRALARVVAWRVVEADNQE
jgi:heat shock protein HslJ